MVECRGAVLITPIKFRGLTSILSPPLTCIEVFLKREKPQLDLLHHVSFGAEMLLCTWLC